jgi:hypothetical protein
MIAWQTRQTPPTKENSVISKRKTGLTAGAASIAAGALVAVMAAGGAAAPAAHQHPVRGHGTAQGLVSATRDDTSWHRYHQDDVDYKRGDVCRFAVHGKVLRDKEYYRNVNFWPNGKVRTQLFRGPLVFRWTNQANHSSVRRDQSGRAYVEYTRAGVFASLNALSGHFGAGFHPGSTPHRGLFYLGGRWTSVSFDAKGHATLSLGPDGTSENLCLTLR